MDKNYHSYRDSKGRFAKRPTSENLKEVVNQFDQDKPLCPPFVAEEDKEKVEKFLFEVGQAYPVRFIKVPTVGSLKAHVLGDCCTYKHQFPNMPQPTQRHFINVVDENDGEVKVLSCGNRLLRKIGEQLQKPNEPKEKTPLEKAVLMFCEKILGMEIDIEPETNILEIWKDGNPYGDLRQRFGEWRVKRVER